MDSFRRVSRRGIVRRSSASKDPVLIAKRKSRTMVESVGRNKQILRVFIDEKAFKTIAIDISMSVRDVSKIMSKKLFKTNTSDYAIMEYKNLLFSRVLDPEECVIEIVSEWPKDTPVEHTLRFGKPPKRPDPKKRFIRFYMDGGVFKTLAVGEDQTAEEIMKILSKKCWKLIDTSNHRIIVVDNDDDIAILQADENICKIIDSWDNPRKYKFCYKNSTRSRGLSSAMTPQTVPVPGAHGFSVVDLLGSGGFGQVWRIENRSTKESYAMKVMGKKEVKEREQVDHTNLEREILEVVNDSPFVVAYHSAFQTPEKLYIVMEHLPGASLFERISTRDRPLSEDDSRFYGAQVVLALEALHRHQYVYRDMKLENILLDDRGNIRLTDFGLSHKLNGTDLVHSFSGTAIYLAPEVLHDAGHEYAVDWWGFGVLMFILMTQEPPFWDENHKRLFSNIKTEEPPFSDYVGVLSEPALDLLRQLLCKNAKARLGSNGGAQELKDHEFFDGIDWDAIQNMRVKPPFVPDDTRAQRPFPKDAFDASFKSEFKADFSSIPDAKQFPGFACTAMSLTEPRNITEAKDKARREKVRAEKRKKKAEARAKGDVDENDANEKGASESSDSEKAPPSKEGSQESKEELDTGEVNANPPAVAEEATSETQMASSKNDVIGIEKKDSQLEGKPNQSETGSSQKAEHRKKSERKEKRKHGSKTDGGMRKEEEKLQKDEKERRNKKEKQAKRKREEGEMPKQEELEKEKLNKVVGEENCKTEEDKKQEAEEQKRKKEEEEEETRKKEEEEVKRKKEEETRRKKEEQLKQREEEKRKLEEKKARLEEEKRKLEEEKKRMKDQEEERRLEEEERKRKQVELKKLEEERRRREMELEQMEEDKREREEKWKEEIAMEEKQWRSEEDEEEALLTEMLEQVRKEASRREEDAASSSTSSIEGTNDNQMNEEEDDDVAESMKESLDMLLMALENDEF